MTTIKTAISLQENLFTQMEELATRLDVSRSQIIALALEAFIERDYNQRLLEALNQAYAEQDDDVEPRSQGRRLQHRKLVEGEW